MPGTRLSTLPISYHPPNRPKRQVSHFQLKKVTWKRTQWSKEEAPQTGSLKIQKGTGRSHFSPFHSIWMAGSKNKFSDLLKRKGKSPESKEKAPILKIAYSDTVIPRIPVSSRSHWSSKISSFSKSIKPACAKTNTKCKINWLFPSIVNNEGLQKCIASRKKERDLKKKKHNPCWQRREES